MVFSIVFSLLLLPPSVCCCDSSSLHLLVSPSTPSSTLHKYQSIPSSTHLALSDSLPSAFPNSTTVLDLLNIEYLSHTYSENFDPSICVINGNEYNSRLGNKLWLTEKTEIRLLGTLAGYLRIQSLLVLLSDERLSQYVADSFPGIETQLIVVTENIGQFCLDTIVRKFVKSGEKTALLLLLHQSIVKMVYLALWNNELSRALVLLSTVASHFRFQITAAEASMIIPISLFLLQNACENAKSESEYIVCELNTALWPERNKSIAKVMSVVNSTAMCIGAISQDTVVELAPILWQTAVESSLYQSVLTISMNNGSDDPREMDVASMHLVYFGAILGISHVNENSRILPRHRLEMFNLSLGVIAFDDEKVERKLVDIGRDKLGVATLTGAFSGVAMGVYSVLSSLNFTLPQIGASNTSPLLSSPRAYSEYVRVSMSDGFISVIYGRMMKHFGWTHVCMVYWHETWSEGMYNLILNETKKLNIEVQNREEYRKLPPDPDANCTDFARVFQEVIRTKVRIVILILYGDHLYKALETLYDLGMRSGDLVLIAVEWLEPSLFLLSSTSLSLKIKELCQGAIMFYPSSFVGPVGGQVLANFQARFQQAAPVYSCYYYDAVMMVAHALDFSIAHGHDYQSSHVLNREIRSSRFVGCSGVVTLEEGTNDRSPILYSILNARVDSLGEVSVKEVGTYDPSGVVLFRFATEILWPGNTTETPTDMRVNAEGCPFESKHVGRRPTAIAVSDGVMAGVCGFGLVVSLALWWKCWSVHATQLKKRAEASFEDYFVYITMCIEALQYANFSPSVEWASLCTIWIVGGEINSLKSFTQSGYWMCLSLTFGMVVLWAFLLVAAWLNNVRNCAWICDFVESLAEKLLPLLGNLCFVPIISILLSVFQCRNSITQEGEETTVQQSFLQWDCYEFCWQSPHVVYASVSLLCLIVYIPSAVYLRPAWQYIPSTLHIHTSPSFLMLKSMYQLILIGLEKTLRDESRLGHALAFFSVTLGFTIATGRCRPFGYSRANWWHFISLMSILWLALLVAIHIQVSAGSYYLWMYLLLAGLLVLFLAGCAIQAVKIPALLYAPSRIHVVELFQFMFSRGNRYMHIFQRKYNVSSECSEDARGVRRFPTSLISVPGLEQGN